MKKINYYDFFGVKMNASEEEICNAIIKMMDKFDEKYGMLGENAVFYILDTVFDGFQTLTDAEKREKYDLTFGFEESEKDVSELFQEYSSCSNVFAHKNDDADIDIDFGPFSYAKTAKKSK